jgi:hypothetical protein
MKSALNKLKVIINNIGKAQEKLLIKILNHCKYGIHLNVILANMIDEILFDNRYNSVQMQIESSENYDQKKWECFLVLRQFLNRDFPFCEIIFYKPDDLSWNSNEKIVSIYIVKPNFDINGQIIKDKQLLEDILTSLQEKTEIRSVILSDFPSVEGYFVRPDINFDIK